MIDWISVKDRLPDRAGYYIVCWKYEHSIVTGEVWYENRDWTFPHYGGDEKDNPPTPPKITHWMIMPLPPIDELAEELCEREDAG
jgi:hypothetical protein